MVNPIKENYRIWKKISIVLCIAVLLLIGSNIIFYIKCGYVPTNTIFGQSGGGYL